MKLDTYSGDLMTLEFDPRWTETVKRIPGSRARKDKWYMPATLTSFLLISHLMQGVVQTTPAVADLYTELWGKAQKRKAIPPYDDGVMMEHQTVGVQFLECGSALLSDDMGLGKTLQAIRAAEYPMLVVCPKSVAFKWQDEFEKWGHNVTTFVAIGTKSRRLKAIASYKACGQHKALIINYESLSTHIHLPAITGKTQPEKEKVRGELSDEGFATIVADECHKIKNRKAIRTRALKSARSNCSLAYGLTGTPLADSPEDFWSIMNFIDPNEFTDWARWRDIFVDWAPSYIHEGIDIYGFQPETKGLFHAAHNHHFIRRTKDEVLDDRLGKLPVDYRRLPMETKQGVAYRKLEKLDYLVIDDKVLATTDGLHKRLRSKQTASALPIMEDVDGLTHVTGFDSKLSNGRTTSNKFNAMLDILSEGGDDKLVVFTESKLLCKAAADVCREAGYLTVELHEEVSIVDRAAWINDFQNGSIQVICLTTGVGAEGIDLYASNRVLFLQLPDSNIAYKQATDRIDRIGQTRYVQPIVLLSEGTVDEDVVTLLEDKEDTLQEVVQDAAAQ